MKKHVMTGVAVALFALIVPLGLVLFESRPSTRKVVKKPVTKAVAQAATPKPAPAELPPQWTPLESVVAVAEPASNDIQEVGSDDTLASQVDFFGGRAAGDSSRPAMSPATEAPEPMADPRSLAELIAAVEIGAVTPDPMPSVTGLSEEDELFAAAFDKLVAENAKPDGKAIIAEKDKTAKPEDLLKRVVVTYVRPKDKTVHSTETFIGKTSARGIPVFLVRSHEPNSPWWVQETAIKQGIYFRASARFGNANTPDGRLFDFVIAFVPRIEDVPDLGSELIALPPEWTYSPEVLYTLKRN